MISYQTIAKNIATFFAHLVKVNFVFLETGKHESSIPWKKKKKKKILPAARPAAYC